MPAGWASYFKAVKAGRYAGLLVKCPVCGEAAPRGYKYAGRKWRWLAVHMARH